MTPIPWTTEDLIKATGGRPLAGGNGSFPADRTFSGISIDSRKIKPGELFLAIRGERFDGHGFIEEVVDQGACGVIVSDSRALSGIDPEKTLCIQVTDTTKALGRLAAFQRERAGVKVLAITGSSGKTTTKNLAAAVLSKKYQVLATPGNLNNEIGLPLTLLGLGSGHEVAVVELGMNSPGEIHRLSKICRPDLSIITNIGTAHMERFGSTEKIADAKGELLENMTPGQTAILNRDDPMFDRLRKKMPGQVAGFGKDPEAVFRVSEVRTEGTKCLFNLHLPGETLQVGLDSPGEFMALNAAAVAGAGRLLGVPAAEIREALEEFTPVSGRMHLFLSPKGIHVMDDTYNANPDAMKAAIKSLASVKAEGRRFLVAGEMLELGESTGPLHESVGEFAAKTGIDAVYATGSQAGRLISGALKAGMGPANTFSGSKKEILERLGKNARPGDWVLVKGSRGMKMEEIVQSLKKIKG